MNEVDRRQKNIIQSFELFEDWTDKYAYLISLGKSLPDFSEDEKNDINLVEGCQSQVWFSHEYQEGKVVFKGISDALIVSGLIGLLLNIYNNLDPKEIVNSQPYFLKDIGLEQHLSMTRNNGLHAMLQYIYLIAQEYAAA